MTAKTREIPADAATRVIGPGSTIGILGGGQLGRMLAVAAARLGYHAHIYCPEPESPAAEVAGGATVAAYDDEAALDDFARRIDVATAEFENVPAASLARLARCIPVRPGAAVLEITQDRLLEKEAARAARFATAAFASVNSPADLAVAIEEIGLPSILKTRRFGYDGKGQMRIERTTDPVDVFAAVDNAPSILEAVVDFKCEISVIAARDAGGEIAAYIPVENRHRRHILDVTIAPASIGAELAENACEIATGLAQHLDVVGLLTVEMFVTADDRLLVNELAPRVHNSGHWTIEACQTSQFEQTVRAITGLPLGDPARHANAVMRNLIGDDWKAWPSLFRDPRAFVHIYGKKESRPGRKMGHVTRLFPLHHEPEL